MTDIISRIHEDIEEYESLCQRFGEKVQTSLVADGNQLPDCYGKHAAELKKRRDLVYAQERRLQQGG